MPLFDENKVLIDFFSAGERIPVTRDGKTIKVLRSRAGGVLARRNDTNTAWIVGSFESQKEQPIYSTAFSRDMLKSSLSGKRFALVEGGHPYFFCIGSLPSGKILLSALRGQHGPLSKDVGQIRTLAKSKIGTRSASEWLSQDTPVAKKDLAALSNLLPGAMLLDAKINPESAFMIAESQDSDKLKLPFSHATQSALDASLSGQVCCYETQEGESAFSGYGAMKRDMIYFVATDDEDLKIFIMRRISYCLMRQPAWLAWPTVGFQIVLGVAGAVVGSIVEPGGGTAAGAVLGSRLGALAGMTISELISNVIGAIVDVVPYLISCTFFAYEYSRTKNEKYKNVAAAALLLAAINLLIDLGLPIGLEQIAKTNLQNKALLYVAVFVSQILVVALAEIKLITPALRDDIAAASLAIAESGTAGSYSTDVQKIMDSIQMDTDLGLVYQFGSASDAGLTNQ
jgi:hypothetical protein